MLHLLADRFLCDRGHWFDLATACAVRLRLDRAGSRREQFEWSDRCAALWRLRHPMLSPLLDYGHAAAHATFEAYALVPPLRAGVVSASQTATHALRFLRAQGITLRRDDADLCIRAVEPGGRTGRPVGVLLQHRRILDALADVLAGAGAGPVTVTVAGPPGSGVRTLQHAFARAARLAGYVPVSVGAARRWPQLADLVAGRHVCLMSAGGMPHAVETRACWLARLGIESTRRHVHLTFARSAETPAGALQIDPLGVAAMTSMIHVDPDYGPSTPELLAAIRDAGGWPGGMLAALRGEPFEAAGTGPAAVVHETHAPYDARPAVELGARVPRPRRMASALARAERRACALASAGRHGAALRLLERAIRLLDARGEGAQAAHCALRLAWIARSRGDGVAARRHVERARALTQDSAVHAAASAAAGVLWTDEGRHTEAEAALRGALAAGSELGRADLARRAALGLARTLWWQTRPADALTALEGLGDPALPEVACEALALAGRIHASTGDVGAALGAASQALQRCAALADGRLEASAHRAMAIALAVAGDADGAASHAAAGLRAATRAHLPLTAMRLRAAWLVALRTGGRDEDTAARVEASLRKAHAGRRVPDVVRRQIERALAPREPARPLYRVSSPRRDPGDVVSELVDAAQRAPDDAAALTRVLEAIVDRLHAASGVLVAGTEGARVLATSGRTWRERSAAARRALETGLRIGVDRAQEPPEAAEPVKYAGTVIGALACRWPAGSRVDPAAVALYLGSAALAVSPHLQTLLDAREAPPQGAWGDLLGDSAAAATLREAVQRAARAPFPILIEGESGSGKELVARAIHRLGPRRDRRFCAINCAAITDELIEAELFGHARGAFTGAAAERAGLFEEADGGSLFLDEVGELSARAQAKLLRVVQDGEVRRVGENFPRRVDVRLVAATNRRLEQEVSAGRFRADLRFRLDVVRITVPALRDRVADIPVLAAHFWQDAASRVGSRATLGPDALAALARYDWPGNVRELQNAIAWMAVHAPRRGRIGASLLPSQLAAASTLTAGSFEAARTEFERRFVRAALAQTSGHRARTAAILGVSRQGLAKMLRRLGIEA